MPDRAEPAWLPSRVVVRIAERIVSAMRGPFVFRDAGALDAALMKPNNLFHYGGCRDVLTLAVALMFAIARAHRFLLGNKRTAFVAFRLFLLSNGYDLGFPFDEEFGKRIVDVIDGTPTEDGVRDSSRPYVVPIEVLEA